MLDVFEAGRADTGRTRVADGWIMTTLASMGREPGFSFV